MSGTSAKPATGGGFWWIFRTPIILGVLSFAGLVLALVGDGALDVLSSAAVALPVAIILWAIWGRALWRPR